VDNYTFEVSADRLIPSKRHEGGFGQYILVPDIERALVILEKWKGKIERGEYDTPTASDQEAIDSGGSVFVRLGNFPELEGLTRGLRQTMRSPRNKS
jgi:hypothetical protein